MLSCGTGMRDIRPHDERILEVGDGDHAAFSSRRCDFRRGGAAVGGGVALGGISVEL